MTKTDLVNYIAEETGLTKADATRALDAMMSGVIKGLKKEKKVFLFVINLIIQIRKIKKYYLKDFLKIKKTLKIKE